MTPAEVLERYWGYDSFRECQAEIIGSVLGGRDTIGLLPTGGGKSITFHVPALLLDGLTIVVTPLISLMKDQVDNLRARGVAAACLNSSMTLSETRLTVDRLLLGKIKLLYVSPEKLARAEFMARIAPLDVALIVVDEAHCISQWGYDFRPSYLKIGELRKLFPDVPVLALTATATPEVVSDIADKLGMRDAAVFSRSFSRDNISYLVRHTDNKFAMLRKVLANTAGPAIVYTRSRKRTVELAAELTREGFVSEFYHGGLLSDEKTAHQDSWMAGNARIMVATNAFGMGIDKPDVRLVVHYDMPPSLEEYYQEAGRAGRDGLPSFAVLLVSPADRGVMKRRLKEQFPSRETIADIYEKACVYLDISMGEGENRLYEFNFSEFCTRGGMQPRMVSSALGILTRAGCIEFNEEPGSKARFMVVARREDLYHIDLPPLADELLQTLLRTSPGAFAAYVPIDEVRLGFLLKVSVEDVYQSLLLLSRMHIVSYIPKRRLPYIYMPYAREEKRHLVIPRSVYEDRLEHARARMEAMLSFVFESEGCRVEGMLRYFGDPSASPCGRCDACRERRRLQNAAERHERLGAELDSYFESHDSIAPAAVAERWKSAADDVIALLRSRVEEGSLVIKGNIFCKK